MKGFRRNEDQKKKQEVTKEEDPQKKEQDVTKEEEQKEEGLPHQKPLDPLHEMLEHLNAYLVAVKPNKKMHGRYQYRHGRVQRMESFHTVLMLDRISREQGANPHWPGKRFSWFRREKPEQITSLETQLIAMAVAMYPNKKAFSDYATSKRLSPQKIQIINEACKSRNPSGWVGALVHDARQLESLQFRHAIVPKIKIRPESGVRLQSLKLFKKLPRKPKQSRSQYRSFFNRILKNYDRSVKFQVRDFKMYSSQHTDERTTKYTKKQNKSGKTLENTQHTFDTFKKRRLISRFQIRQVRKGRSYLYEDVKNVLFSDPKLKQQFDELTRFDLITKSDKFENLYQQLEAKVLNSNAQWHAIKKEEKRDYTWSDFESIFAGNVLDHVVLARVTDAEFDDRLAKQMSKNTTKGKIDYSKDYLLPTTALWQDSQIGLASTGGRGNQSFIVTIGGDKDVYSFANLDWWTNSRLSTGLKNVRDDDLVGRHRTSVRGMHRDLARNKHHGVYNECLCKEYGTAVAIGIRVNKHGIPLGKEQCDHALQSMEQLKQAKHIPKNQELFFVGYDAASGKMFQLDVPTLNNAKKVIQKIHKAQDAALKLDVAGLVDQFNSSHFTENEFKTVFDHVLNSENKKERLRALLLAAAASNQAKAFDTSFKTSLEEVIKERVLNLARNGSDDVDMVLEVVMKTFGSKLYEEIKQGIEGIDDLGQEMLDTMSPKIERTTGMEEQKESDEEQDLYDKIISFEANLSELQPELQQKIKDGISKIQKLQDKFDDLVSERREELRSKMDEIKKMKKNPNHDKEKLKQALSEAKEMGNHLKRLKLDTTEDLEKARKFRVQQAKYLDKSNPTQIQKQKQVVKREITELKLKQQLVKAKNDLSTARKATTEMTTKRRVLHGALLKITDEAEKQKSMWYRFKSRVKSMFAKDKSEVIAQQLQNSIDTLTKLKGKFTGQIKTLKSKMADLQKQDQSLLNQFDQANQANKNFIKNKIIINSKQISQVAKQVSQVESQLTTVDKELERQLILQGVQQNMRGRGGQKGKVVNPYDDPKGAIAITIVKLEKEKSGLKQEIMRLDREKSKLIKDNRDLNAEIKDMKEKISTMSGDTTAERAELQRKQTELNKKIEITRELIQKKKQINALIAKVDGKIQFCFKQYDGLKKSESQQNQKTSKTTMQTFVGKNLFTPTQESIDDLSKPPTQKVQEETSLLGKTKQKVLQETRLQELMTQEGYVKKAKEANEILDKYTGSQSIDSEDFKRLYKMFGEDREEQKTEPKPQPKPEVEDTRSYNEIVRENKSLIDKINELDEEALEEADKFQCPIGLVTMADPYTVVSKDEKDPSKTYTHTIGKEVLDKWHENHPGHNPVNRQMIVGEPTPDLEMAQKINSFLQEKLEEIKGQKQPKIHLVIIFLLWLLFGLEI